MIGQRKEPMEHFLLPPQPEPSDTRPRNAFGSLLGFGEAYRAYYEAVDKGESRVTRKVVFSACAIDRNHGACIKSYDDTVCVCDCHNYEEKSR